MLPPFSSAKDPVNIAGYTASNIMKGDTSVFHWNEVQGLDRSKVYIVDVRTKMEFSLGTIEGAINIPVDELRDRLTELRDGKDIYLFCQAGLRGYIAERILMQQGFEAVKNLSGGYMVYNMAMQSQLPDNIIGGSAFADKEESRKKKNNDEKREVTECGKPRVYKIDVSELKHDEMMLRVAEHIKNLDNGDLLEITTAMPLLSKEMKSWCESVGCILLGIDNKELANKAIIQKERDTGI